MNRTDNRIKWKVVDKILEETKSTPQQLLDWLEWGFSNLESYNWLCLKKLYLGKYFIETEGDREYISNKEPKDRIYIFTPTIITGKNQDGETFCPATTWGTLITDLDFRGAMIARFKKHYKLK